MPNGTTQDEAAELELVSQVWSINQSAFNERLPAMQTEILVGV